MVSFSLFLSALIISRHESFAESVLGVILQTSVSQYFNLQPQRGSYVHQLVVHLRDLVEVLEWQLRATIRLASAPTNLYPVEITPLYW